MIKMIIVFIGLFTAYILGKTQGYEEGYNDKEIEEIINGLEA